MNPLVSIIIPTYNRAQLIVETLQSVLDQTYQNWECIVVDDLSTDDTDEALNDWTTKDKRFKYYKRHREPKGAPTCRNIGLDKAQGEYVIFLDSDDLLEAFCLKERIDCYMRRFDCDFLVFQSYFELNGELLDFYVTRKKDNYLISFLSYDLPWWTTSVIWKVETLRKLNGFDEKFPRLQDPELCSRALMLPGIKFEVFEDFVPDSRYRLINKKPKLLPALGGFYQYAKNIFPQAINYNSLKDKGTAMKMFLFQVEKFFVDNFERRNAISAISLMTKIQLLALRLHITDFKYFLNIHYQLIDFYLKNLINYKKPEIKILGIIKRKLNRKGT